MKTNTKKKTPDVRANEPPKESKPWGEPGNPVRCGAWTHESWVDSLTKEALQNCNRAIVACSDLAYDDTKALERVSRALAVIRSNLRAARQNHLRPLLVRSGDRPGGAQ